MKRHNIKRRPLADTVLNSLEPDKSEYRELDGDGLYIRVKPNGRKSWNLRYKRPNGSWSWKGVGRFPQVSGKAAREEASRLNALAADGLDLSTLDESGKSKPMFSEIAWDWYKRKRDEGLAPKTLRLMRDALDKDVLPPLKRKRLDQVSRADCTEIQDAIEDRGAWHIAKKVRSWLNQMFSLAIAQGKCEMNPASELRHVASKTPDTQHHPYLLEPDIPALLDALKKTKSLFTTRVATFMVLLTASRPGMVRLAEWVEINIDEGLWSIPGEKMKKSRDHLVPLPSQLIPLLQQLHEMTGAKRYLFPGTKGNQVISYSTINSSLAAIGYHRKLVGHGSRHTASTLLREHGWRRDYVEMQLSHVEGGVSGVYNKAQYLKQRRKMMQWYADYIHALNEGITAEQQVRFASLVLH